MKILIAGATGFIGRALIQDLAARSNTIVVLTRGGNAPSRRSASSPTVEFWDGKTPGKWCTHLESTDVIINLAGASIAGGRWTDRRKQVILESRVDATRAIVQAIRASKRPPHLLINASAVGYYGASGDGEAREETPPGNDFLGSTCVRWESEALKVRTAGIRLVLPRLGVVLARDGGAIQKMRIPFALFAGGPIGTGNQWYPWVHRDDVVGAFMHFIDHPDIDGPVNLVAPEAVTMAAFAEELGKAMGRPSWLPVPRVLLRLVLGEMAEMILEGRKIVPAKLVQSRFVYRYPTIHEALQAVVRRKLVSGLKSHKSH
jgi:uncharacterized protein